MAEQQPPPDNPIPNNQDEGEEQEREAREYPTLKLAWQTLIRYDSAALQLKRTHVQLRALVLILSFFASALAVGISTLDRPDEVSFQNIAPFIMMIVPLLIVIPSGYELLYRRRERLKKQKEEAEDAEDRSDNDAGSDNVEDDPNNASASENSQTESQTDNEPGDVTLSDRVDAIVQNVWEFLQTIEPRSWWLLALQVILLVLFFSVPVRILMTLITFGLTSVVQVIVEYLIEIVVLVVLVLLPFYVVVPRMWSTYRREKADTHPNNRLMLQLSGEQQQPPVEQQTNNVIEDEEETPKHRFPYWVVLVTFALSVSIEVSVITDVSGDITDDGMFEMLRLLLFALPLISTGILAYATRFIPSLLWVQYRSITESIRREIFLFRFKAEAYKDEANAAKRLHNRLKEFERGKRLKKADKKSTTNEGVAAEDSEDDDNKDVTVNNGEDEWTQPEDIIPVNVFQPDKPFDTSDADLIKQISKTLYIDRDDIKKDQEKFFERMRFENYLKYRVYRMYDWYTQKSYDEFRRMRRWQVVALIIGGAGSFLAFIGQEPWVAVTTSGAVTVGALANLQLAGRTYLLYYRTANDLVNRVAQMRYEKGLTDLTKDLHKKLSVEEMAELVEHFEDIFRQEGELWRRQAIDALSQVDSSISDTFRSGTGSEYSADDWLKEDEKANNG